MSPILNSVSVAVACFLGVSAAAADAATIEDRMKVNAAGACQGALPAFAGALRARPLALQNEGTSTAFVTCSLPTNDLAPTVLSATLRVINNGTASADVTCTAVNGTVNIAPLYVTKTATVAAGGGQGLLTFRPADFDVGLTSTTYVNWSCELPPGTGIGWLLYSFNREIGA